jgi:hypothetical protein
MIDFNKNENFDLEKDLELKEETLTRAEDMGSAVGIGLGYLSSIALPLWLGWEIGEYSSSQMNLGMFSDYLTRGVGSIALTAVSLKYFAHYFGAVGFVAGLYTGVAIDSVKSTSKKLLENIARKG